MSSLDRRRFLQASAALGSALVSSSIGRATRAAPVRIDAPVVDRVVIREITDNSHNIFLGPLERPGLSVQRVGFPAIAQGKTLESEWGLALHIESTRGGESRRYLLDFGFTPDVYANNLGLLKIDPAGVDALILSPGGQRRRKDLRAGRRLPPFPGARRLSARGHGGTKEVRPRARDADALQRAKLRRSSQQGDAGELVRCGTGSNFTFTA